MANEKTWTRELVDRYHMRPHSNLYVTARVGWESRIVHVARAKILSSPRLVEYGETLCGIGSRVNRTNQAGTYVVTCKRCACTMVGKQMAERPGWYYDEDDTGLRGWVGKEPLMWNISRIHILLSDGRLGIYDSRIAVGVREESPIWARRVSPDEYLKDNKHLLWGPLNLTAVRLYGAAFKVGGES